MGGGGKNSAPAPVGFSNKANESLTQGIENRLGGMVNPTELATGQEARDQAITSAYDQASSRLNPAWDQRESAARTQMINQGLDPGSQAFDTQMGNLGRERNDAFSSAMANAIGQGTSAGNSIFQNSVTGAMLPYTQLNTLAGISDSQYQNALQGYGTEQAGKNSMLSGLGSLGGMAGGAMLGGPAGAAIGSRVGSKFGGG
jgi:hypothetical protein